MRGSWRDSRRSRRASAHPAGRGWQGKAVSGDVVPAGQRPRDLTRCDRRRRRKRHGQWQREQSARSPSTRMKTPVRRAHERPLIQLDSGVTWEHLAPDPDRSPIFGLSRLHPRAPRRLGSRLLPCGDPARLGARGNARRHNRVLRLHPDRRRSRWRVETAPRTGRGSGRPRNDWRVETVGRLDRAVSAPCVKSHLMDTVMV